MCKDIKLLDTAKQNLTSSVNALRKFSDLMASLDNLTEFVGDRNYKKAFSCLEGVNDLVQFFDEFKDIPQVEELLAEKDATMSKIKGQIKMDFTLFFRGLSELDVNTLQEACKLVEIMGHRFRNEILQMPAEHLINPYRELYEKEENATVDKIE